MIGSFVLGFILTYVTFTMVDLFTDRVINDLCR